MVVSDLASSEMELAWRGCLSPPTKHVTQLHTRNAGSEERTHDFRIIRPQRYQLRYSRHVRGPRTDLQTHKRHSQCQGGFQYQRANTWFAQFPCTHPPTSPIPSVPPSPSPTHTPYFRQRCSSAPLPHQPPIDSIACGASKPGWRHNEASPPMCTSFKFLAGTSTKSWFAMRIRFAICEHD